MYEFRVIGEGRDIRVEAGAGIQTEQLRGPIARILALSETETAGISRILFIKDSKLPDGQCRKGYYGLYPDTGEWAIVVTGLGRTRSLDVMLHEVGHHVYRKLEEIRDPEHAERSLTDRWGTYWRHNRLGPPVGRMPNWSSFHSEKEAFAEVYKYDRMGKRLDSQVRREFVYLLSKLR